jgi:hypothetical protein
MPEVFAGCERVSPLSSAGPCLAVMAITSLSPQLQVPPLSLALTTVRLKHLSVL